MTRGQSPVDEIPEKFGPERDRGAGAASGGRGHPDVLRRRAVRNLVDLPVHDTNLVKGDGWLAVLPLRKTARSLKRSLLPPPVRSRRPCAALGRPGIPPVCLLPRLGFSGAANAVQVETWGQGGKASGGCLAVVMRVPPGTRTGRPAHVAMRVLRDTLNSRRRRPCRAGQSPLTTAAIPPTCKAGNAHASKGEKRWTTIRSLNSVATTLLLRERRNSLQDALAQAKARFKVVWEG